MPQAKTNEIPWNTSGYGTDEEKPAYCDCQPEKQEMKVVTVERWTFAIPVCVTCGRDIK